MERVAEVMRAEGAKPQERERAFGAWALLLLTGATLAGLAVMLRRRRQGVSGVSAPPTPPVPSAPAAKDAVAETSGLRAYEPSALVQRFGAQSLLSQRDWSPVLDQVEMALAYGRLAEAEAALSAALDEDPHSVALRLQSLALAVEQRDRPRFEQEAASLARGADATLLAKLEELEERLPPPSPPPEAPGLANRFILETPEDEEDALAPGAKGALPSLGAGLSLVPEGEGLDGGPSEGGSPSRD